MSVAVKCPSCGRASAVREESVGRKVKCPHCGGGFEAQVATQTGPAAANRFPAPAAPQPPAIRRPSPPAELQAEVLVSVPISPPVRRAAVPVKEEKDCPFCGELVLVVAKKCKHCGETIDVALRAAEEARRAAERGGPSIVVTTSASGGSASSSAAAAAAAGEGGGFFAGIRAGIRGCFLVILVAAGAVAALLVIGAVLSHR